MMSYAHTPSRRRQPACYGLVVVAVETFKAPQAGISGGSPEMREPNLCVCRQRRRGGLGRSEDRHGQLVALHAHRVLVLHRQPGGIPHRVTHGPRYTVSFSHMQKSRHVHVTPNSI